MAGCIKDKEVWEKAYADKKLEIKTLFPDYTQEEINRSAFREFLPLYRQDWRSAREEEKNMPETPGPDFKLTSEGNVYYPQYGGATLNGLHESQKRLMPERYSLTDHQTSRAIDCAFQDGATVVITSYSRAGMDNRDLIVMTYDPATGVGKTKIINTAVDHNYHSFDGIKGIAKNNFQNLNEISLNNAVFILTDKSLSNVKIHQSVNSISTERVNLINRTISYQLADQIIGTTGQIAMDMHLTAGNVAEFIKNRRLNNKHKKESITKQSIIAEKLIRPKDVLIKKAENTKNKILNSINKDINKFNKSLLALFFIKEQHAGFGAVYIFLRKIMEVKYRSIPKEKPKRTPLEKNIARLDNKQIIFSINKPDIKDSDKAPVLRHQNFEKKEITNTPIKFFLTSFIQISRLIKQAEKFFKKNKRHELVSINKTDKLHKPLKEQKIIEKILIFKFKQIYFLWIFIKLSNFQKANNTPGMHEFRKEKNKESDLFINNPEGESILAAIIWYLAQIREQGHIRSHTKKKKQKNKKNISGIIYQYHYS